MPRSNARWSIPANAPRRRQNSTKPASAGSTTRTRWPPRNWPKASASSPPTSARWKRCWRSGWAEPGTLAALDAAGVAAATRVVRVQERDPWIGEEAFDQRFQRDALDHLGVAHPAAGIVGAHRQQPAALLLRDR